MRLNLPVLMMTAFALAACSGQPPKDKGEDKNGGGEAASSASAEPSLFASQIAPILQGSCATCHLTGQEAGNMSLVPGKAIASLVNVKSTEVATLTRVVPGDPDNSYLIMKLEGTQDQHGGMGARMPFGAPPLTQDKIDIFRKWIAEGAKP